MVRHNTTHIDIEEIIFMYKPFKEFTRIIVRFNIFSPNTVHKPS